MQLQWLAVLTKENKIPKLVELTHDITVPAGAEFTPIGDSSVAYNNSTFDGCGHTITGLQIDVTEDYRGSLFGYMGDVTVQDLTIDQAKVTSTSSYIGAVAGLVLNNCTFRNVHVSNSEVYSPISYGVGGFAGQISGPEGSRVEFINCSIESISITGYANVGSFWGTSTGSKGTIGIYNSTVAGTVTTKNVNGAICGGYTDSAKVQIIGLDHSGLITAEKTSANLLSAVHNQDIDTTNAGKENQAIKNENGDWVVKGSEGVGEVVASVDGVDYTSLVAALGAVQDGQTVQILANTTVDLADMTYKMSAQNVTLDLNGKTVRVDSAAASNVIQVSGSLTIQDSSEAANGVLDIHSTNTAMCNGISVADGGSLNVASGTVAYTAGSASSSAIRTAGTGVFAMSGGKIKTNGATGYAVFLGGTALSEITGGEILLDSATTASTVYGVYASNYWDDSEGCEISNLTVDASNIPATKRVICVGAYSTTTPLSISGGTYRANGNAGSYAVGDGGFGNKTSISGGTFVGAVTAANGQITGGSFTVCPAMKYLPDGKIFQKQADGTYHVVDGSYVASLNGVGYITWEELFEAIPSDSTAAQSVSILSDVEEIVIPEGKNISLWNVNNCTIGKIVNNGTCSVILNPLPGVQVVNNGTLSLGHEVGSVVNNAGATMTGNASTTKVTGTLTNHGTLTLSKGSYLGQLTNDGKATITGGTFGQNVEDLCADGYTTQQNREGNWDVVKDGEHVAEIDGYWYTSLSDALAAAQNGETVKLLINTTLTAPVTINNKNIALDMNGCTVTCAAQGTKFGSIILTGSTQMTVTGNGTFTCDTTNSDSARLDGGLITAKNSSVLTIENGTYCVVDGVGTLVLVDNTAECVIKGGTFDTDQTDPSKNYLLNIQDTAQGARFRIFGGTFVEFNPSQVATEGNKNFCAPGYITETTMVGGKNAYNVVKDDKQTFAAEVDGLFYITVTDAVKDLKSGSTMKLLIEYTGDPITIEKIVTIDLNNTNTKSDRFVCGTGFAMKEEGGKLVFSRQTFNVSFQTNGGSAVSAQSVVYGAAATQPTAPTRAGYRFDGWYADQALTQVYDFSQPVYRDLMLYAKWTKVSTTNPGESGNNQSQGNGQQSNSQTGTTSPAVVPQTGDNTYTMVWAALMAVSGCLAVALVVFRRRKV